MLERLPADLAKQSVTHSSWTDKRSDSYERLAFLGDSVLGLAVTTHLYPRLQPDAYGAGRLTKVRAQAVSGRSCRDVAERLGIPERLKTAAPPEFAGPATEQLARTERVLASVIEAVIGACYLEFGYEPVADAVVEAFQPEIERALAHPADFKSALQEQLARRGTVVIYEVASEEGPPHERTFEVAAMVDGEELARGSGRSKKDAEQAAAETALEGMERACSPPPHPDHPTFRSPACTQLDHAEGLQVLPGSHAADVRARRVGDRGPERVGQVQHHGRRAVGARRAVAGGRARRSRCRT